MLMGKETETEVTLSEAAAILVARRFLSMIFPRREQLRETEDRGGSSYIYRPERKGFRDGVFRLCFIFCVLKILKSHAYCHKFQP